MVVVLALSDSDWGRLIERPNPAAAEVAVRCTSQASLVEKVASYEFFGARATDAGNSLRQRLLVSSDYAGRQKRFTGQTDWHIEWRACLEAHGKGCRVSGVVSTVNVTYTLPRWADREAAPPHLRERWDRYITSLVAHEKGHGTIARHVAGMIDESLVGLVDDGSCDALTAEAGRRVEGVMQRGENLQREYDRSTGHGSTQGAQFPF